MILYTYLHLAAELELTQELAKKKVIGVAYETIQLEDNSLPLLRPMSEVAGRMAVQVGASCLEKERGGKGVLLGGVPGTRRGRVVILGGGVVGRNAATIAVGMGAQVTVLDVRAETMSYLEDVFGGAIETLYSNAENIESAVMRADLVVGAVLVPGAKARSSSPRSSSARWRRAPSSSTSPSIRAAASPPAARPRTTTRRTRSTASSTTAWPTCPAPSRTRAPGPSPTPR